MKKTVFMIVLCLVAALCMGGAVLAGPERHGPSGERGGFDGTMCGKMFHQNFFSPNMIMRHQQELGLTAEQKTYIKAQIQEAESTFSGLEWDLQEAISNLDALTAQKTPDEKQILAQLDKVLDLENKIKRARLSLMIRLKNKLTPEQQTKLMDLRGNKRGCMGGKPPCMEKKPCPMAQDKAKQAS